MNVAVVDYGAGNTRSVLAALRHVGLEGEVTSDPFAVLGAARVILPGVGSARSAMEHLRATGVDEALRKRLRVGDPILGICLGLQLAMTTSEEDGGVETLNLCAGEVTHLGVERVPRLGWALVEPWGETFYFAHSFAANSPYAVAFSEGVTAAVEAGSFLGVQFHPEKSGPVGLEWLERCLTNA